MDNLGIPRRPLSKAALALQKYREKRGEQVRAFRELFIVGDCTFDTKEAAQRHMRRPHLERLTADPALVEWLLEHHELILDCFWADDQGLGERQSLLPSIPGCTPSWAEWVSVNRTAIVTAYNCGQGSEVLLRLR